MKRFLPLLAVLLAGCVNPPDAVPPAPDAAPPPADTDYSKWPSVTREPYPVDVPTTVACAIFTHDQMHGPHSWTAIVVRVNPVGREAFLAKTPMPVGTVVVKEKLLDGKTTAVGTMTKREPGYDADSGDWEYGYRELRADAPPPTSGKIESCIACHRIAKDRDYLYRPYLKK